MSLVPVTVNVLRYAEAADAYGGAVQTASTVYSSLLATFNFYNPRNIDRLESANQGRGAGVQTRTEGVIIFDPKPDWIDLTVSAGDRVNITSGDYSGTSWQVTGVREYEFTMQLDVERVS